jgi:hypothetical protein
VPSGCGTQRKSGNRSGLPNDRVLRPAPTRRRLGQGSCRRLHPVEDIGVDRDPHLLGRRQHLAVGVEERGGRRGTFGRRADQDAHHDVGSPTAVRLLAGSDREGRKPLVILDKVTATSKGINHDGPRYPASAAAIRRRCGYLAGRRSRCRSDLTNSSSSLLTASILASIQTWAAALAPLSRRAGNGTSRLGAAGATRPRQPRGQRPQPQTGGHPSSGGWTRNEGPRRKPWTPDRFRAPGNHGLST